MNEQELRALVREAVERHLRHPSGALPTATLAPLPNVQRPIQGAVHSSHLFLKVIPGSEAEDGMCVIEPAVRCNHCGFCQSYGH